MRICGYLALCFAAIAALAAALAPLGTLSVFHCGTFPVLREKNNLSHMVGVVRDLAVDGLQYGVGLAANRHLALQVLRAEAVEGVED